MQPGWGHRGGQCGLERDGATYYYHYDGYGSVSELTDEAGALSQAYEYDAWGTPTIYDPTHASQNPYLYTGRRWDASISLYYYRARHYAPDLGRFLQPDPAGYADGPNLYAYGQNAPTTYVDPTGMTSYDARVMEPEIGGIHRDLDDDWDDWPSSLPGDGLDDSFSYGPGTYGAAVIQGPRYILGDVALSDEVTAKGWYQAKAFYELPAIGPPVTILEIYYDVQGKVQTEPDWTLVAATFREVVPNLKVRVFYGAPPKGTGMGITTRSVVEKGETKLVGVYKVHLTHAANEQVFAVGHAGIGTGEATINDTALRKEVTEYTSTHSVPEEKYEAVVKTALSLAACHEIGHAAGLHHVKSKHNTVMSKVPKVNTAYKEGTYFKRYSWHKERRKELRAEWRHRH